MAKKEARKRRRFVTKVSGAMSYEIVLDSSGGVILTPIPDVQLRLGNIIKTPAPGAGVRNPVAATGQALNDGPPTTVTVWVKDIFGHSTYASVTGPDAGGNWSASFPNLAAGSYALTAQAQLDGQTASETISITVS